MVTAPLICTNKYDNLSIKLVTTAVRMPRVWDESCEKKRERAVLMIQNLPTWWDSKPAVSSASHFLRGDHTSIATWISRLLQYAQLLKREIWFKLRKGDHVCVHTTMVNFINLQFPFSSELKIHPFRIVVGKGGQRNLQERVRHVQSCCFCFLNLLIYHSCSRHSFKRFLIKIQACWAGISITAGSQWNLPATSRKLVTYFSLEITPVFTNNMI